MKNSYVLRHTASWRRLVLAGLLGLGATAARAQNLNYIPEGASNITTTYTDLGATGTTISTPNTDDANSAAQPIGFTFSYNGQSFTDFVLNTNGFLKLGTTAPAAPFFFSGPQVSTGGPLNNAAETNLLLPFNVDLESATAGTAEYRVATTGAAPNRVCTIQWKNVSDKASGSIGKQLDNFQFQVKLYETTNRVEFVYGSATAGAGPNNFKYVGVGLKGSGTANNQLLTAVKGSAQAWSGTGFMPINYSSTTNAHNIRLSVLPDAGRTYRFNPQQARDASISAVYTLGKLPVPYGAPHVIRAFVRNLGTTALTNVNVTVTVTGANSFTNTKTIGTLGLGIAGTLSFDAFTPTATGTNNVTVTIASDDDNANNTATYTQQITTDTYSYANPSQPASGNSVGLGTNAGILATKFIASTPLTVTSISVRLDDPNSVGKTIYAVVCNNAGTIISRTPDYVVTAADIATSKSFPFSTPVPVATGDFYTGIAQTASTTAHYPIGVQVENPTRSGAYYIIDLAGGQPDDVSGNNLGRLLIDATIGAPPTCPPPSAVTVSNASATTVVVSATGTANATGYTIIYGPRGFDPNGTARTLVTANALPYTLTGLTASTTYDLYIRANCSATDQSALSGPVAFTTLCTPPVIANFPYAENFNTIAPGLTLPCGITVADVNGDNNTWRVPTTVVSPTNTLANAMMYGYNSADATKGGDDWFFTPALALRAGSRYQLSFKYKTDLGQFPTSEKLEVKYGTGTTPAEQTNLLWRNENITNTALVTTTSGTGATQVMPITPGADGTVYIGFHAYSAADQFNLYVDDISINSVVTGLSDALVRAVNVYPNPSAGMFTVEVRGANAKGAMQVEVTNLLGQRVHTATIRDNSENRIDLSTLASGMYTMKVLSGNDYMIRNIVVQK
ncbi:T9SS-dependent choice-of-anchor J family protein [Hymenobacter wooponensis]|uniref:T9SS type A sorting domain-containing protein n=1 Tax=Hymenobacter wooponensis TaxID=1525360 RepID=A0A4Z0MVT6_9BACT|nr:choice-of-anchor J domain-containing protein [Hymenobacter wooponensis]TGD83347.1 T9SS type A sorting domain-containing protein [Hymenobacter wooponensis]